MRRKDQKNRGKVKSSQIQKGYAWATMAITLQRSEKNVRRGVLSLHKTVRSPRQETVLLHRSMEHKSKIILVLKKLNNK